MWDRFECVETHFQNSEAWQKCEWNEIWNEKKFLWNTFSRGGQYINHKRIKLIFYFFFIMTFLGWEQEWRFTCHCLSELHFKSNRFSCVFCMSTFIPWIHLLRRNDWSFIYFILFFSLLIGLNEIHFELNIERPCRFYKNQSKTIKECLTETLQRTTSFMCVVLWKSFGFCVALKEEESENFDRKVSLFLFFNNSRISRPQFLRIFLYLNLFYWCNLLLMTWFEFFGTKKRSF